MSAERVFAVFLTILFLALAVVWAWMTPTLWRLTTPPPPPTVSCPYCTSLKSHAHGVRVTETGVYATYVFIGADDTVGNIGVIATAAKEEKP